MASFKEAFAAARKAGKKEFAWNGKQYNTKLKSDSKAKAPARPEARPNKTKGPSTRPSNKPASKSPSLKNKGISPTKSRISKNIAKLFRGGSSKPKATAGSVRRKK